MTPQEIIKKRKDLMLTQQELAEELGVTKATVVRWEKGTCKINPINARKLEQLSKENSKFWR